MDENKRLPIQVVLPRKNDYSTNPPGGSKKELEPFEKSMQKSILNQCIKLQSTINDSFSQWPSAPCVGKVIMKDKAIAKTHKPTALFKATTCPIVGSEKLEEVLIKVTPSGLDRLITLLSGVATKDIRINITKIQDIFEYPLREKIGINGFEHISKINQPIKVKLFSFDQESEEVYSKGFEEYYLQLGIPGVKLNYGKNLCIYKLDCKSKMDIEKVIEYPGVHKVSFFPNYVNDVPNISKAKQQAYTIPTPEGNLDYPIVGIIDSGIQPGHKYLEPWIFCREKYVADDFVNYEHGTFVAGVIEYGEMLNLGLDHQQHFRLLDVVVFPNGDPSFGPVDSLSEDRLIEILHEVFEKYHDDVKVWNMSLGTDQICEEIISDLAMTIDSLQDTYKVQIVLSAGNYCDYPLRPWPPVLELNDADRITTPADSIRSLTVGSVANVGIDGFVDVDMPSPFSRKGPGANYLVKPDLVHYGGNCTQNLDYTGSGVVSFDINGDIIEGVGTSYSTPSVSAIIAGLENFITEDMTHELSKAFLIHSAQVPPKGKMGSKNFNQYYGHGIPQNNVVDILSCSKSKVTLVFTGTLYTGSFIEFNDFPYPRSLLHNGKYFGEISMTLVYTPKINSSFGQEYCRTNIDAHLGTYDYITENGSVKGYKSEVPIDRKWDEKFEKAQVENGFKWNPIKSYSRMIKNGIAQKPWRLMIDSVARLGENYNGQEFVLLISISDPKNNDIYSEVILSLRERGFLHHDIKIQNSIRQAIGLEY
jgi:serine protease AprX